MENLFGQTPAKPDTANRRARFALAPEAFLQLSADEVERAIRYDRPLSVALVLIDGLARLRKAGGPALATSVIDDVSARLLQATRGIDRLGRLGPAQLGILLPETRVTHAVIALQRVTDQIAATPVETATGPSKVTLSVGIAALTPRMRDPRNLLMTACQELRRARGDGGNRVSAVPVERIHISLPRSAGLH